MELKFNSLIRDAGIDPRQVRLLRHQTVLPDGRTPFDLWVQDRDLFNEYQSYQQHARRSFFLSPYWSTFVGLPDGRTMFSGLYRVDQPQLVSEAYVLATGQAFEGGIDDRYPLQPVDDLSGYRGILYVEWGGGASGKRAWTQRADLQDKTITELHLKRALEPFPGFGAFIEPLSRIPKLPESWTQRLSDTKGVYLLTCPDNDELYVGSATGSRGFLGRWLEYDANGHGGNVVLKQRGRKNYQVSILEVAGSHDSDDDIRAAEQRWMRKLRSKLNGQFAFAKAG